MHQDDGYCRLKSVASYSASGVGSVGGVSIRNVAAVRGLIEKLPATRPAPPGSPAPSFFCGGTGRVAQPFVWFSRYRGQANRPLNMVASKARVARMNPPPAEIGVPVAEVETPALIIDLDALDRNIAKMAEFARASGVRVRPHAKTHKSTAIALRQIALGAVGQCVQKVGEAEVLVRGGVKDVLVSNQVVGERKLRRLAALAKEATVALCFDSAEQVDAVRETLDALAAENLPCEIIGGAGTGTFAIEAASGVYNELQVGSYVFMDTEYARIRGGDGRPYAEFEHSLFVLASVISVPTADRAIVDAGLKSYSAERGPPWVHDRPDVEVTGVSDEHGKLKVGPRARPLSLGEKVWLIPGHCDPTVNLHDWYVGVRKGRVETLWPINARGASI